MAPVNGSKGLYHPYIFNCLTLMYLIVPWSCSRFNKRQFWATGKFDSLCIIIIYIYLCMEIKIFDWHKEKPLFFLLILALHVGYIVYYYKKYCMEWFNCYRRKYMVFFWWPIMTIVIQQLLVNTKRIYTLFWIL